jgi:hypothetical protein
MLKMLHQRHFRLNSFLGRFIFWGISFMLRLRERKIEFLYVSKRFERRREEEITKQDEVSEKDEKNLNHPQIHQRQPTSRKVYMKTR